MKVTYVVLCDYALFGAGQKTSLIDVFHRIDVENLPAEYRQAFVAFEILVEGPRERGVIPVRIACVDSDEKVVFEEEGKLSIEKELAELDLLFVQNTVRLTDIELETYGKYEITIYVEDEPLRSTNFWVVSSSPSDDGEEPA